MPKDTEQFISEMETETLIKEMESKWAKWDNDNRRYLIMGLCGDWYYTDQFLHDRVQETSGDVTKDMPLWQNNTIEYYNRIFLKIYKDHKDRLLKHLAIQ
jgi:hypothetical protein|tara:strand:- start:124 stop:423 length:300 start_codon:yes stop_codon:yes gene_type:complete